MAVNESSAQLVRYTVAIKSTQTQTLTVNLQAYSHGDYTGHKRRFTPRLTGR